MEAGDQVEEEPEDDYTPLDPAYLPPGLEEEDASDKDVSKDVSVNLDEVSQHSTVFLLPSYCIIFSASGASNVLVPVQRCCELGVTELYIRI